MTTCAKNNIQKPIQNINLITTIPLNHHPKPHTVTQALKDPKWRQAISEEYDALANNGT